MNTTNSEEKKFLSSVPFYINGSLSSEEHAWMDAYLAQHPQHQAHITEVRLFFSYSQNIRSELSEEGRLVRLHKKLGWNESPTASNSTSQIRARHVLTWPWASGLIGVISGISIFFVIGQFNATFWDRAHVTQEIMRSEQKNCQDKLDIRITPNPQVQWAELVQMLRKLQLQLVNGPTQDGEVWARANAGTSINETLVLLRNSPLIEQALPADPTNMANKCRN